MILEGHPVIKAGLTLNLKLVTQHFIKLGPKTSEYQDSQPHWHKLHCLITLMVKKAFLT